MPKAGPKRLTQLTVDRIRPPHTGEVSYPDGTVGGLSLRVKASGNKAWAVVFRVRGDPRQIRETLGPAVGINRITLSEARQKALASIEKAKAGINPRAERQAAALAEAGTFAAVAERFFNEHVERNCRPRTIAEYRRQIDRELIPQWGARPIREITKGDVNALLDKKAETLPLQANEVRKHLRTLFRWALDLDLIAIDPTAGTRKRAKPVARDRVLDDAEIRLFWNGCAGLGWPFGAMFRLLLLTGQRRNEVAGLRWGELDLEKEQIWTIPAERAKNAKSHLIHLSPLALKIIEGLPRFNEAGAELPFLFSTNSVRPPSGFSHAKTRLDGLMAKANGGVPIPPWVPHDVRRTMATGMARLKVQPHVVDRILNHVAGSIRGVAAVYNRFQYEDERRDALDAWSCHVERLVAPGENVIVLNAAR